MNLGPPPWIAAHRGAAPLLENTIPSLLRAVEEGADFLEFDVQATADGVLVLHHDPTLERLAGRPDLTVEAATFTALARLELRHPGNRTHTGRISTLTELFAVLPSDFAVNVEVKSTGRDPERLSTLTLEATAGRANVLVSSFDWELLRELRRRSPEVRLAPLAEHFSDDVEDIGRELRAWSLHIAVGLEPWEAPARRGEGGAPILVYTVNDAAQAHALFARGVSGVFTDRPGALRAELGRAGDSGVLSRTYRGTRAPSRSA